MYEAPKSLKSEYLLLCIIIFFSLFVSIFPTIFLFLRTPKDAKFSLAFNYYPDYYHYISWMKDGQEGHLSITTRFTSEGYPRKIVLPHILYPILGIIATKTGLNLFQTYLLSRILFGSLRLALIYVVIAQLFTNKKRRILAFIVTIGLPSFLILHLSDHMSMSFFLPGITTFDVFRRITFIPHHLLAHIFNILYFVFLSKGLKDNNKKYSIVAGLSLFLASVINPATLFFMPFIITIAFVLILLVVYKNKVSLVFYHFTLSTIPVLFAAYYYKYYLFTIFPWDILGQEQKGNPQVFSQVNYLWTLPDYLGALGLAMPLSIIAFLYKKFEKNILYLLIVAWAVGSLIAFILISQFINYREIIFRLFQGQQFVPFGILAAFGIFYLHDRLKNKILRVCLVYGIISISLPYYYLSLHSQLYEEITLAHYNIYLPKSSLQTFDYLDKNTPDESVVLTGYYFGELLPAYTHNRVYKGTPDQTYDYNNKIIQFTKFYNNQMNPEEVKNFIKKGNISYILFGPDTGSPEAVISRLPFVKLLYQNKNNYVYKVLDE